MVKTADYSFRYKWNNTAGASAPTLIPADTVFKNQYFFLTAIAWEYARDNQGFSDVQYSIKMTRPDGSIYLLLENLPLIHRNVTYPGNLQMSDTISKLSFKNDDAFGSYKIELEILDKVSGKTKSLQDVITLSSLPAYDDYTVKDDSDLIRWTSNYFINPQPARSIAYYIYFAHSTMADDESTFWPVFSGFFGDCKK